MGGREGDILEGIEERDARRDAVSLFDSYFRFAFLYPTYKRRILE